MIHITQIRFQTRQTNTGSRNNIANESERSYIKIYKPFISPRLMMTSSNEKNFRGTGLLCGKFTCHRWIPRTKASDAAHNLCLSQQLSNIGDDLRRHRENYDAIVMYYPIPTANVTY